MQRNLFIIKYQEYLWLKNSINLGVFRVGPFSSIWYQANGVFLTFLFVLSLVPSHLMCKICSCMHSAEHSRCWTGDLLLQAWFTVFPTTVAQWVRLAVHRWAFPDPPCSPLWCIPASDDPACWAGKRRSELRRSKSQQLQCRRLRPLCRPASWPLGRGPWVACGCCSGDAVPRPATQQTICNAKRYLSLSLLHFESFWFPPALRLSNYPFIYRTCKYRRARIYFFRTHKTQCCF